MTRAVAVVTGASRGIGRAVALRLARDGYDLVLNGTRIAALEAVTAEVAGSGCRVRVVAGDVADPATAEAAARAAQQTFGRVDLLVNNAGINTRSSTLEMPLADWQRVIDVNLSGTLHFCRAVLPTMIAAGAGCIVNISSTRAKTPHVNAAPAYGASKAGVNYLTMHLAQEMACHGIRVNAVCPGAVETDMSRQWSPAYRARVTGGIPLSRLGMAEEVAGIVAFLASDDAGFVTGETINANGGAYMN